MYNATGFRLARLVYGPRRFTESGYGYLVRLLEQSKQDAADLWKMSADPEFRDEQCDLWAPEYDKAAAACQRFVDMLNTDERKRSADEFEPFFEPFPPPARPRSGR